MKGPLKNIFKIIFYIFWGGVLIYSFIQEMYLFVAIMVIAEVVFMRIEMIELQDLFKGEFYKVINYMLKKGELNVSHSYTKEVEEYLYKLNYLYELKHKNFVNSVKQVLKEFEEGENIEQ